MGSRKQSVLYVKRFERAASPLAALRQRFPEPFTGQDGFFRGALYSAFHVKERSWRYLETHRDRVERHVDWVVVNFKAGGPKRGLTEEEVRRIGTLRGCRKALFINYAKASLLPPDSILDPFDLVFKRELLKDTDCYGVSASNADKLRTTMLACPLVPVTRRTLGRFRTSDWGFKETGRDLDRDIFFSGALTNPLRLDAVKCLQASGLDFVGGLQDKAGDPLNTGEPALARIDIDDYVRQVRSSRVNLALEGIGEFTFRHLELWCLCAFMVSTPSVRDVRTPIDAEEGRHYVCFDGLDDLVDKVRYYLEAESERNEIACRGRRLFERNYDFVKHGRAIRSSFLGRDTSAGSEA